VRFGHSARLLCSLLNEVFFFHVLLDFRTQLFTQLVGGVECCATLNTQECQGRVRLDL
jgi:hypothetical protein